MSVPNVAPNMPYTLPGMPNGSPGTAPTMMQSQQAGGVQLGCMGCTQGSLWSRIPMWAKIAVPITLLTGTLVAIIYAANRRSVVPYEALETEDDEEVDF